MFLDSAGPDWVVVLDELYEWPTPIDARFKKCDQNGLAVWSLRIGGQPIEGR